MPTPRPLLFNLTRLINRSEANGATGIDRVDLRHARYALEQRKNRIVLFLWQQENTARRVPETKAAALIDNLERRWLNGEKLPPVFKHGKRRHILNWPRMQWQQFRNQHLPPTLLQALSQAPGKPLYLHSGHGSVQYTHFHTVLREQLQADLIFYLHDLIPIDFPEYTNAANELQRHHHRMHTMATTGTQILANSEDSKQRFLNYCEEQQLPKPPTDTLLIGVEPHILTAASQPKPPIPQRFQHKIRPPFFITVSTIEPRKNHILLLHLWRKLTETLGKACPQLVIIGKRGWNTGNLGHLLDRSPALKQHVLEINDANDPEMIALVQNAHTLLFPSFAEGWGMPLAEALSLNVPAICSDIPALRECGKGHGIYLDPLDGLGWEKAILNCLEQHPEQSGYAPDTWEDHLKQLNRCICALDTGACSPHPLSPE